MSIHSRKEEHVQLALSGQVQFRDRTTGLERYTLVYNALPEINFQSVTTACNAFGHTLQSPFLITGMTGGYDGAEKINGDLAEAAAECGIALGVGSMRAALESETSEPSYSVVRSVSHRIPIIANIGGVQAAQWLSRGDLERMLERACSMVGASALAIHLNPLQELMQPEGEPQFAGVLKAIAAAVAWGGTTIIVKEVGAGISGHVAQQLAQVGVSCIDVAGAGGTSWAGIEIMRHTNTTDLQQYWDVGIPTADALVACSGVVPTIIASGGISGGRDATICCALGANLVGFARLALEAQHTGGTAAVVALIRNWELSMRRWMFLTGSQSLADLRLPHIICTTT